MRTGWRRWRSLRLQQRRRQQRQRRRPWRTTEDGCGDRVGGRPWNRAGCCSWRSCPATCGPLKRPSSTTKLPLRCSLRPRHSVLLWKIVTTVVYSTILNNYRYSFGLASIDNIWYGTVWLGNVSDSPTKTTKRSRVTRVNEYTTASLPVYKVTLTTFFRTKRLHKIRKLRLGSVFVFLLSGNGQFMYIF